MIIGVNGVNGVRVKLNILRHEPCPMYHRDDIDLIRLDPVDNPVWFFNQLPDIFSIILGHHPAGQDKLCSAICSVRRVILSIIGYQSYVWQRLEN